MPGLLGYWTEVQEMPSPGVADALANAMRHQPDLKIECVWFPGFEAGRVHLGYFQPGKQPVEDSTKRYSLWLDGEFNNASELSRLHDLEPMNVEQQARLALALYLKSGWSYLKDVDGLFTIALYDRGCHRLTLANDRYGLRPLYWVKTPQGFAFAGEVKALLCVPGVEVRIDPHAVDEWFSFGYLLGNRTWIEGIELYPPATIMHISMEGIKAQRYWSWQDIRTLPGNVNEQDIADELGRLWIRAVETRVNGNRVGQYLSGGLDSRAIIAALPPTEYPYHALTFGIAGCDDVRIARQVARIKGVQHHFVEITAGNWLEPRIGAVWRTDGMGRILDLHGAEALGVASRLFEVNLHGAIGGAIAGGTLLFPLEESRTFVTKTCIRSPLVKVPRQEQMIESYVSLIEKLGSSQAHYLEQRWRRFIANGTLMASAYSERRFPFAENSFSKFALSVPDALRYGSRLYSSMLLRYFPAYYKNVPWQRTGLPVGAPDWRCRLKSLERAIANAMRLAAGKLSIPLPTTTSGFTDYPTWLRAEPARSFITYLLLSDDALYASYIDHDAAQLVIKDFFGTENNRHLTTVGLLLTFEIYLRQLIDKDFEQACSVQ